jgi:hypothetical protein
MAAQSGRRRQSPNALDYPSHGGDYGSKVKHIKHHRIDISTSGLRG